MRTWLSLFIVMCVTIAPAQASRMIGKLEAGDTTYYRVVVQKVEPDAIFIRHQTGIAKVPLADLSPNWQRRFRYDPEKAKAWQAYQEARKQAAREKAGQAKATVKPATTATAASLADQVLPLFATAPAVAERMDLRPQYRELGLYAKNQGRRPSCAVFSVVSALEYQQARNTGQAEKLSEEYLIWATRKSLGLEQATPDNEDNLTGDADLGFTLTEVVQALRTYGIAAATDMPNTFGKRMAEIEGPDDALVADARARRQVHAYQVTGRSNDIRLARIVHLLNEQVPVVVGMAWPHYRTIARSPLISKQKPRPGAGHAVTLVGYKSETGKLEDAKFQFKNSWGPQWGNGGYGWITYDYLKQYLHSAVFLDCQ